MTEKALSLLFLITLYIQINHVILARGYTKADYCKLGDPVGSHTVCAFGCEYGVSCADSGEFRYLSDAERELMLNKHNQLRNEVAQGEHANQHLKAAKNMNVLSYDKELEWIMGCWLKQCKYEHDDENCRANGAACGQNLFWRGDSAPFKMDNWILEDGIQQWFDKIKNMTEPYFNKIVKFYISSQDGNSLGSLTQLIWAETKFVGCAKISYREEGKKNTTYMWVVGCNYEPLGNIGSRSMYVPGFVACKKKNTKYNYLCGEIRPINLDPFKEPFSLGSGGTFSNLCKPNLLLVYINTVILLLLN